MKAIMSVIGQNHPGIVARVSKELAEFNINIVDISQTLMDKYFTMILLVEAEDMKISEIQKKMTEVGKEQHIEIRIQAAETFDAMHLI